MNPEQISNWINIENIDQKPIEGLESVGASWWIRVRFGIMPQVLPLFFSYSLLRLEINVRASTILGFVGAGGIGPRGHVTPVVVVVGRP